MTSKVGYRGSSGTFEKNLREFLCVEPPFDFPQFPFLPSFLFHRDNRSLGKAVDRKELWYFMGNRVDDQRRINASQI